MYIAQLVEHLTDIQKVVGSIPTVHTKLKILDMKRFEIQLSTTIELEFDENSDDFKLLYKAYNESISKCANYEDLLTDIAQYIARYGVNEEIEGVGYLQIDGVDQTTLERKTDKEGKLTWIRKIQPGYVNLVNSEVDLNGKLDFIVDYIEEIT